MHKNTETTEEDIFHIHFDGQSISGSLYDIVTKAFGFVDSDFAGSPEGYNTFYPQRHLTLKLPTKSKFIEVWHELEKIITLENFKGYLEGEYIPSDVQIDYKEFDDTVPFPFTATTRKLDENKFEKFRQTELHLVLDMRKSDKRLVNKLLNSGMFPAEIDKGARGYFIVFTAQGYVKDIQVLIQQTFSYLSSAGGAVNCTLKEERAINHHLYGIRSFELPEIVDKIELHI